jgi:hypothetical protein
MNIKIFNPEVGKTYRLQMLYNKPIDCSNGNKMYQFLIENDDLKMENYRWFLSPALAAELEKAGYVVDTSIEATKNSDGSFSFTGLSGNKEASAEPEKAETIEPEIIREEDVQAEMKAERDSKKEMAITTPPSKQPIQNQSSGFGLMPTKEQIDEYSKFLKDYNEFIDKQLVEGTDYGKIPGVDKPSLFKPGAEKLEKLLFLRSEKIKIESIINPDFIKYTYKTVIYDKEGNVKGTCEGTCNSKETKYRYTTVFDNQATPEQKKIGSRETKKSKAGKTYTVYKIEKKDVYDLENTIMKMAQKRSYVGALLEATNSSGRFTCDVEDNEKKSYNQADGNNQSHGQKKRLIERTANGLIWGSGKFADKKVDYSDGEQKSYADFLASDKSTLPKQWKDFIFKEVINKT